VGFTGVLRGGAAPVVGIGMTLAVQDTHLPDGQSPAREALSLAGCRPRD
jgi:hypothetical protein